LDLRTFVTHAMTQIREGVEDAHFRSQNLPAGVFIRSSHVEPDPVPAVPLPEVVEFDLAVTVHRVADHSQGGGSEHLLICSDGSESPTYEVAGAVQGTPSRIRFCVELGKTSSILKKPLRTRGKAETNINAW
jgi:hypothetical protein